MSNIYSLEFIASNLDHSNFRSGPGWTGPDGLDWQSSPVQWFRMDWSVQANPGPLIAGLGPVQSRWNFWTEDRRGLDWTGLDWPGKSLSWKRLKDPWISRHSRFYNIRNTEKINIRHAGYCLLQPTSSSLVQESPSHRPESSYHTKVKAHLLWQGYQSTIWHNS